MKYCYMKTHLTHYPITFVCQLFDVSKVGITPVKNIKSFQSLEHDIRNEEYHVSERTENRMFQAQFFLQESGT